MTTKPAKKAVKAPRNPQDTTLRNVRAAHKRFDRIDEGLVTIGEQLRHLQEQVEMLLTRLPIQRE